jgi:hypothetical protein
MSPAGNAQSQKLASDVKLDSGRPYVNSEVHGEIIVVPQGRSMLGGAAAWPVVARAQQPAVPVIGHLYLSANLLAAFSKGVNETGFVVAGGGRIACGAVSSAGNVGNIPTNWAVHSVDAE